MSLLESLHHVAVTVKDVEKAKHFYTKVFELKEMERLTRRVSQHRGAWFHLGSLELHLQERTESYQKTEQHFAVLTHHFEEIQKRVLQAGGRIEEAKLIEGIAKRCFLYDLDENRIELLQRA